MTDDQTITVKPVTVADQPKPARAAPLAAYLTASIALLLALASLLPWFVPAIGARMPVVRSLAERHATDMDAIRHMTAAPDVVEAPVATALPEPAVDVTAINERFDSLQAQLLTVNTAVSVQGQRLEAQQTMAGEIRDQSVSAALKVMQPLLTLQVIRGKIDSGAAFARELQSLEGVMSDADRPALEKLANGGAALDEIAASIDRNQRQLVAAYREEMATTWWEKLKARLSSLIYIRTMDPAQNNVGDDIGHTLDKLTQDIRHGDSAAVQATLDTLPASMKALLGEQATQLQVRQQALDTIDSLAARLMAVQEAPQAGN